ncbi:MAG: VOC family protein [Phycisphaeraceae bacterium]|nr:VOC family protein [Phycisphaeraceae bacterium]
MQPALKGLHHVTAFARDPLANVTFYRDILGLRMIKKTVNFDDPSVYHLYFGDRIGSPGTLMTFFPNPNMVHAEHGHTEIRRAIFRVPIGGLAWWERRFKEAGLAYRRGDQSGTERITFSDPDGLHLGLEEAGAPMPESLTPGVGIPAEVAISAIAGVVLHVPEAEPTNLFLAEALGFQVAPMTESRQQLRLADAPENGWVEVVQEKGLHRAHFGAGMIHHVAWRASDDESQHAIREHIARYNPSITNIIDRQYFKSIYFAVPPGLVFEVATDGPGFTIDQSETELGHGLMLPPQHEPLRPELEKKLVPIPDP